MTNNGQLAYCGGYQPKSGTPQPPPPKNPTPTPHKESCEITLEELAEEIAKRGNDMQTTHSKDGLKVFEVSRKLVKVIPK